MSMSYEQAVKLGIVKPEPAPDPAAQAARQKRLDELVAKVRELEGDRPEPTREERLAKARRLLQAEVRRST